MFSASFRNGPLKTRREDHLLDVEEALLPATQWYARMEKRRQRLIRMRSDMTARIVELEGQMLTVMAQLGNAPLSMRGQYKKSLEDRAMVISRIRRITQSIREGPDAVLEEPGSTKTVDKTKKVFIRKCPRDNCKGYLSTHYKCGLCKGKVCSKCLEAVDAVGGEDTGCEHVCNPDTVASIQALMKDTKPCPKCGTGIYKIDGCDQMFCTECKTAFSWNTGKIETGLIHNPHWYEWQRRMNNGEIAREPGDIPGGGGCVNYDGRMHLIPGFDQFMYARDYDVAPKLVNLHRVIVHMVHVVMPRLMRPEFSEETNRDLRIKYLLGSMDKTSWKRVLYQREKKREKDVATRQALEVFINVSAEALWKLTEMYEADDEFNAIRQLDTLRKYTNECLVSIQKRFNSNHVMTIDSQFIIYNL